MPVTGNCLKLSFSVTNQLGVIRNDIPRDNTVAAPDLEDFVAEVTALFGGDALNVSRQIYAMTEAEKLAALDIAVPRYGRRAVSGTYWLAADPTNQVGFYLSGLGPWVSVADVQAFIIANTQMPGGAFPDTVFVGAFKAIE